MAELSGARGSVSAVYTGYDVSAPGANTGITGGLTPAGKAAAYRVTVALTAPSVFNVTCTDGSTPHKWGLNASAALNAADIYTFTFGVRKTSDGSTALTYDFEVESDGVIECLFVEEIAGPVL